MRKFCSTIRIAITLVLARTFGRYQHSVWNGELHYAVYEWRGHKWAFPTEPVEALS